MDSGRLADGFMTHESTVPMVGAGSCASCHSRSSGTASIMEPTQMTASLARIDWHRSMGLTFGRVLVATWKRSMPRAQRLKVVTPKEETCEQGWRRRQRAQLMGAKRFQAEEEHGLHMNSVTIAAIGEYFLPIRHSLYAINSQLCPAGVNTHL